MTAVATEPIQARAETGGPGDVQDLLSVPAYRCWVLQKTLVRGVRYFSLAAAHVFSIHVKGIVNWVSSPETFATIRSMSMHALGTQEFVSLMYCSGAD